jgi:hypothetical protein
MTAARVWLARKSVGMGYRVPKGLRGMIDLSRVGPTASEFVAPDDDVMVHRIGPFPVVPPVALERGRRYRAYVDLVQMRGVLVDVSES